MKMGKAIFCRCLGTYTMECNVKDCPYPKYWQQGIGNIGYKNDHFTYTFPFKLN
jgi:hypothetical protein